MSKGIFELFLYGLLEITLGEGLGAPLVAQWFG